MHTRKMALVALAITVAVGTSGCTLSGGATGTKAKTDDDHVNIDSGKGSTTAGSDLPEGFPADFPVYQGATLNSTSALDTEAGRTFYVGWQAAADGDVVHAWYKDALSASGWKVIGDQYVTGAGGALVIEKGGYKGEVSFATSNGSTDIVAAVTATK